RRGRRITFEPTRASVTIPVARAMRVNSAPEQERHGLQEPHLVEVSGIEPPTSSLRTTRSSQLSYTPRGNRQDSADLDVVPTPEWPPDATVRSVFADLLAEPGVTEELVLGSRVGLLAFHGGSLESMTDVVAR